MPSEHARLSPSASARWLACPASVRMAELAPPGESSEYADEGTAAHAQGEYKARTILLGDGDELTEHAKWLALYAQDVPSEDAFVEMDQYTNDYVDLLKDLLFETPDSVLLLEQRVNTGLPRCWGTADAIIVSPTRIIVVDFKYGRGVAVSPVENTQAMLYGVGALETYGDLLGVVEDVTLVIHQPRNPADPSTWTIKADELRAWRDAQRPIAEDALAGSDTFGPSETACRWCPAAGICKPRADHVLEQDFGTPVDILSDDDIAAILPMLDSITSWCSDVSSEAYRRIYGEGRLIDGWKVIKGRGQRKVADPSQLIKTILDEGFELDDVAELKPRTFGHLEKLVGGRKVFDALVGRYVKMTDPKPRLVTDTTKGQAITQIASEFSEEID